MISVIVPTLNEGDGVWKNLAPLQNDPAIEIIVVDAKEMGKSGRALQMNEGVQRSQGNLLLFLHADTKIEKEDLLGLLAHFKKDSTLVGGAFQFRLDQQHWRARLIERGVWLRERLFKLPYGDQALFIRRDVFQAIGGYPDVSILEDVWLVQQMRRKGKFFFYPKPAITSARRWERHGYFKTTLINWMTILFFKAGVSLVTISNFRRRLFDDPVRGDIKKSPA